MIDLLLDVFRVTMISTGIIICVSVSIAITFLVYALIKEELS